MYEKELERLARRLADGLRGEHDALGREVVRLLADGHPVTSERLASALQMTVEQVAEVLASLADLEVDQSGHVVGWGLTFIPTPHRFLVQGQQFYTWCALDALTYPALLQLPASVESSCPVTGGPKLLDGCDMSEQVSEPMKKHLRVLTVTLDYPPPLSGGYGVMCAQVCNWLKSRGHEVLVLTALPAEQGFVSADSHEDEEPVPVRRTLRSYWDGAACLDLPFQEALAVEQHNQAQMRNVLATYRPDVVAFWHMGAMSLGLITTTARLGFPLVFVIGDDWLCYGGWTDAWLRWCNEHPEEAAAVEQHTGLPTRLPDLGALGIFCFVSAYTKRRAEQIGGWHFPRAQIIFPGLSPGEFPPLTEVPDQPWRWRLLWVGRVIEEKGVEMAIHALPLLSPQATLSIVGMVEPPYQHHLEALAATLGVASRLSFSLASRRQVRQHYQQADVTLFTSMIEHEAFGLVPLEAMASGCPVIASGVGGSSEYCLSGVNCMHVPPGDPVGLARAVQHLAQSQDLRRHLVEGGLRTASAFTLDRQAASIERALLAFPVHNQGHYVHHYCLRKDVAENW